MVSALPKNFDGQWWVVHTKSRQEKALAQDLEQSETDFYLPLVRLERRIAGRTTQVELPLFPGYLFMCSSEEERFDVFKTRRAVRVLEVDDQEQLKVSLRHIHRMVTGDRPVDVYPGIRRGRRCCIVRGPLLGLEGIVLRRRGVCRICVAIDMLGQSAEVEVDGSLIEMVD